MSYPIHPSLVNRLKTIEEAAQRVASYRKTQHYTCWEQDGVTVEVLHIQEEIILEGSLHTELWGE